MVLIVALVVAWAVSWIIEFWSILGSGAGKCSSFLSYKSNLSDVHFSLLHSILFWLVAGYLPHERFMTQEAWVLFVSTFRVFWASTGLSPVSHHSSALITINC